MRRVKIVCTIGPASGSMQVINRMVRAGMNVARLNFSHGSHEEHKKVIRNIRRSSADNHVPVSILQDLCGLKPRVGTLKGGSVVLRVGKSLAVSPYQKPGDERHISLSYPNLLHDAEAGTRILLDDGIIQLRVVRKEKKRLITRVVEGGELKEKKGASFPGMKTSGPVFTRKDKKDLEFGIREGVDYIAMSYVRSARDILTVKNWLKRRDADIPVIAKIEKPQALEEIDGILQAADGLMIARGDLGIEVSLEKIPLIQKELIDRCNLEMKPVITATQMLESMTEHKRPTRAEVSDVANAVLDGTDALMLSGETAIGKHPVETQKMMSRIISATEKHRPGDIRTEHLASETFAHAIAESACVSAMDMKARAIVCFSRSGYTPLLVSKFRPQVPIICFTTNETLRKRMGLLWGVTPYVMKFPSSIVKMISESESALLKKKIVKNGDSIVIIAVSPFARGRKSNIMKLHKVDY